MIDVYRSLCREASSFPQKAKIVAVSKNATIEQMQSLYEEGCRDFGESRIQTALEKMSFLPTDIRWHLIGSLQSNKINKIIGKFFLVHSIDSVSLAEKLSEKSVASSCVTSVLLEINMMQEKAKHGFRVEEIVESFSQLRQLEGLKIEGLMTMAPRHANKSDLHKCFGGLKNLQQTLRQQANDPGILPHLSMGMSEDYKVALEEGSTLLRIGSALFGS